MKKLFLLMLLWAFPIATANAVELHALQVELDIEYGLPPNCASGDGAAQTCYRCYSGYWLSGNTCVRCGVGVTCDGSANFTCSAGFGIRYTGGPDCAPCWYKTQAECNAGTDVPSNGYWVNRDSRTGSCIQEGNCWVYSACRSPYVTDIWRGTGGIFPGCNTKCAIKGSMYCRDCGPNGDTQYTCVNCGSGSYYKGAPTDPNSECVSCPANGTCDGINPPVCKTGTSLVGTTQTGYSCIVCDVPGCNSCSAYGVCSSCKPGYALVNGKCELRNTVSGNCPDFLQKSSDGCCCVRK